MSGYVEAGYAVVFGGLGIYALSIVARERAVRRRLPPAPPEAAAGSPPPAVPGVVARTEAVGGDDARLA